MGKVVVQHWRSRGSSWTIFARSSTCWPLVEETTSRSSIGTGMGQRTELGMPICSSKTKEYSYRNTWMTLLKWLVESRIWAICGRNWWSWSILENQHHFRTTYSCDVLNVNVNRTKVSLISTENFSNHVFSATATEKLPGWETPHSKTVAWWYDMEKHAKKFEERYSELANKKRVVVKSFKPLLGWFSFQGGGIWISWRLVQNILAYCLKKQTCICHELVDLTFFGL